MEKWNIGIMGKNNSIPLLQNPNLPVEAVAQLPDVISKESSTEKSHFRQF
jgi:hypothetical protein